MYNIQNKMKYSPMDGMPFDEIQKLRMQFEVEKQSVVYVL